MHITNVSYASTSGISAGRIDAMSGASPYVPASADQLAGMRADIKQRSQDFQDLRSSLKSGDLSAAQQAFATLSQDIQNASSSVGKSLFDPSSPIGKDFEAIGKALQCGDLSSAKQAFQAFTRDIRSAHRMQGVGGDNGSDPGDSAGQMAAAILAAPSVSSSGLNTVA